MILPCKHEDRITRQIQPTVDLLTNIDVLHPDILLQHAIHPEDYKKGLVSRSAVESIRGAYIASSTAGREGLVKDVLENFLQRGRISGYSQGRSRERYDFTVVLERNPDYFAAIEVKGGEGNSINISERPLWAKEFGVWCHLDGAIVNQPAHGAHPIVNRLTNELVRRHKLVDVLFFKDLLWHSHKTLSKIPRSFMRMTSDFGRHQTYSCFPNVSLHLTTLTHRFIRYIP